MQTILLTLSYDGGNYHGWQKQNHSKSVQETLERALSKAYRQPIAVEGSGRTDAGVHALGQCASYEVESALPVEQVKLVVNRLLPGDMLITDARCVPDGFHARYHAIGKTYEYKMIKSIERDPFKQRYAHQVTRDLNLEHIRRAMTHFIGTHDFKTYMAAGSQKKDSIRTIYAFDVQVDASSDHEVITFSITGDGFLYNMVRIIMGTLIQIGTGTIQSDTVPDIILSGDRERAKLTAPACGLYLKKVYYDSTELEKISIKSI